MPDHADGIRRSELRHVLDDLQSLVGVPLRKVWVPAPDLVVVGLGRKTMLRLEAHPFPRLHTLVDRPANPATPLSFQGILRSRLRGPLTALRQVGDDRVVELAFGPFVLHARLFGRGGGIWLLEGDRVLAASDGPAPKALPALPETPEVDRPPRFEPEPGQSWDEAARIWFGERAEAVALGRWSTHVRTGLKRKARKLRRLVRNLEADLDATRNTPGMRRDADALAASLHTVSKGVEQVDVPDPEEPGATRTVRLDPSRSPAENLQRLYTRIRRLDRGAETIAANLGAREEELTRLEADQARLGELDVSGLEAVAGAWDLGPPGARRQPVVEDPDPWWTWRGPQGETLWVGRNDRSNHALVFHHARGRDWWLHLRDKPGAHAVVPSTSRDDAPPLPLLLAASQILLQADQRAEGDTEEVQYARVRDLRPIPGAGPGKVTITKERVLLVDYDASRLEGWTASR